MNLTRTLRDRASFDIFSKKTNAWNEQLISILIPFPSFGRERETVGDWIHSSPKLFLSPKCRWRDLTSCYFAVGFDIFVCFKEIVSKSSWGSWVKRGRIISVVFVEKVKINCKMLLLLSNIQRNAREPPKSERKKNNWFFFVTANCLCFSMIFFGSKSCRPKEVSGELMVVVVVVGCVVVLTFIKKKWTNWLWTGLWNRWETNFLFLFLFLF